MICQVRLSEQAKQDLRDIYEYIAFSLLESEIANNLTRRILDALMSLWEMPERYPVYQDEPWKSRGLRRINIGKYSGFYLVSEKEIQVIRILYGGRDIGELLNDSVTSE